MSVSGILKKLYPMTLAERYPMDLSKRRKKAIFATNEVSVGLKADGTYIIIHKDDSDFAMQLLSNCKKELENHQKKGAIVTCVYTYYSVAGVYPSGKCFAINTNNASTFISAVQAYWSANVVDVLVGNGAACLKKDGSCEYMAHSGSGFVSVKENRIQNAVAIFSDPSTVLSTLIALNSDGTLTDISTRAGVSSLKNVVDVSVSLSHIACLRSDGTCAVAIRNHNYPSVSVGRWTNIVDICAISGGVVGLKSDGTCVATGSNSYNDVNTWTDIVAISKNWNSSHLIGLKSDGTCVAAGNNRFGQCDVLDWNLVRYFNQGLLTSKTPVNLLDKTSVSGFTVKGIEPANTKRRVAFKVEDKWNKLSAEGALTPLATQEITADSVLEEGNTVAELEAITTTTGLAGKLIYPAVALYAEPEAEVMPTFGMTVKAEIDTTVNVYSYTGYSQEYKLSAGEDVQVVNVAAETETTGEGNVVVTARLKQGGEWTDYMALSDTAMKQASALQLKAVYTVTNTDGSQSAKVKNVTIRYTTSGATVNGVSTDIVTKTQRFTNDLVYAHCYVKHKKLQDAVIDAYCSLRKRPKSKTMYQFGNGTGALNTYKLPDAGINQDTLSVYVDGKAVYDFGYNTETSEITLTADKDTALSASYECGWELSEWIKMVQGVSQVNDGGGYTTEYSYTVPTHEGYEYTVTAIKYSLVRPEGSVTEETIGVGTGKRQMIELPHFAKKETIVCNGAWSYDYDRKLLTIIAPEGADIVISYGWIAETPTVYAISAGWAD